MSHSVFDCVSLGVTLFLTRCHFIPHSVSEISKGENHNPVSSVATSNCHSAHRNMIIAIMINFLERLGSPQMQQSSAKPCQECTAHLRHVLVLECRIKDDSIDDFNVARCHAFLELCEVCELDGTDSSLLHHLLLSYDHLHHFLLSYDHLWHAYYHCECLLPL